MADVKVSAVVGGGLLGDIFEWLDGVRENGSGNMFGMAPQVADEFGFGKEESRVILKAWMDSFVADDDPHDRAWDVIESEEDK